MTSSKLDTSDPFSARDAASAHSPLVLSESEVVVRRNGLEFLSRQPLPLWSEVGVDLRSPGAAQPLRGNGVVVDCAGSRHSGYVISLLLLDLSAQAQQHLERLARATAS